MSYDQLDIASADLLKSLDDKLDLERNAAEYIIAWQSMQKAPSEIVYTSLYSIADAIIKEKEDGEDTYEYEYNPGEDTGAGLLLNTQDTQDDLTNHIWVNGLQRGRKNADHHSVWPVYRPKVGHPYKEYHFPFHPANHPLLRMHAVNGMPHFVEMLRAHTLGGYMDEEKEMEKDYLNTLLQEKHPLMFGFKPEGTDKTFKLLGSIMQNGSMLSHQKDLYERDFARWKKQNTEREDEYLAMGMTSKDAFQKLREDHFEDRARQWVSEDTVIDDNYKIHPTALGHHGYMLGLEWLSPEERTAVIKGIRNGVDDNHLIELPNGQKVPSARFTHNAIMRKTPEMNWAVRSPRMLGRNASLRLEDNDTDYEASEAGRFLQSGMARGAHLPYGSNDESIADIILNEINELYDGMREDAGKGYKQKMKFLPRLNLHKTGELPELEWEQLKDAERAQFGKRTMKVDHARLPIEDILYMAGFHPKTREPLSMHPVYGKMDGPLVPLDWIENIEGDASSSMNLQQQEKDIRKHLSFLKAVHGPAPSEDKPSYWRTSEDGRHTYGLGSFWSKPFQGIGGAGMTLPTYNEIIHATTSDDDSMSLLGEMHNFGSNDEKTVIAPNQNNLSLAAHFMPEHSREHGHYDANAEKYVYHPELKTIQNILSPSNVSRPVPSASSKSGFKEGKTSKNNFTEHKSSLSAPYEYAIRHMTDGERKNLFENMPHLKAFNSVLTRNPFIHHGSYRNYAPYGSDKHIVNNAQDIHKLIMQLGRFNHLNNPTEKSVISFNDFIRDAQPVSGGETTEDMLAYLGWGVPSPSFGKVKDYLQSSTQREGLRFLTEISKTIQSSNPKTIMEYLEKEDFHDLKQRMGFPKNDTTPVKQIVDNFLDDVLINLSNRSRSFKHKKPTLLDAVTSGLSFGGALPAFEQEEKLQEEVDDLNQRMVEADDIDKPLIQQQLSQKVAELTSLQQRAIESTQGKMTSHWKIDQRREEDLKKAHRMLVTQVAPMIKEKMLEADPTAFDPNDPQKFIDNNARMFRDAQRYITHVPHDVHGLQTLGYGLDFSDIQYDTPPANGNFHQNVASHLQEHGFQVDGNMSVEEVLEALALPKTPEMKEHARAIIDRSNEMNTPLFASTVNQLLMHGNITDLHNSDISHLHDKSILEQDNKDLNDTMRFSKLAQESGYHGALDTIYSEVKKPSAFKSFPQLHSLPRRVKQLMGGSFTALTDANGLEMIENDVHNVQQYKRGSSGKGLPQIAATTRNNLDTILHYNPMVEQEGRMQQPTTSISARPGMTQVPVGAPNPNNHSIFDTFDAGGHHSGWLAAPSVGVEFTPDGQIVAGTNVEEGLYHSVPHELTDMVHGKDVREQVWGNAPPPRESNLPIFGLDPETFLPIGQDPNRLALNEMTEFIQGMLNPDELLMKEEDPQWTPLIRPMHRIFEMSDLEHLRGFSGSWVVSKWYDGKRVMLIKNGDEVTALNEKGKKVGLRKNHREALVKVSDKNYAIDAIMGDEDLNIIDIVNYDNNDISDMLLFERIKILRSQFESHENVIVPGPHDTKMTDNEGLKESVKRMQDEHDNILLRDSKSTYMKGEYRHPKWVLYRPTRDYNFIVLDRRGNGPYTYQLGAGPLLDDEGLQNRAVTIDDKHYMDIGTARREQKAYKVGDIVRVSVSGITKKTRGDKNIYTVQIRQIEGEGEGEGPASTESLDLLTKGYLPINIPHDVEYDEHGLHVILKDIDTVTYQVDEIGDMWYVHSPVSTMGDLYKNDYSVTLAESLQPFWSPLTPLLFSGQLQRKSKVENLEMPKKPSPKRVEENSVGIIEEDDKNILLKPEDKKKALEVIVRTLDKLVKERMTWTGPKGLGIDLGTPVESPAGPTRLTDEENLPDYHPRVDDIEPKKKKKPQHFKPVETDTEEGERLSLDFKEDEPVLSKV